MCAKDLSTVRRGLVSVYALVMSAILLSLSISLLMASGSSMQSSRNYNSVIDARLTAEGGLEFILLKIGSMRLPSDTSEENFPEKMLAALSARLDGTANLNGLTCAIDGSSVVIPWINLEDGRRFSTRFEWISQDHCRLTVEGQAKNLSRQISIDIGLIRKLPEVFDYGLASKGQITIAGNSRVIGVNDPSEASVLSATTLCLDSIHVDGNTVITGDIYTAGENTHVAISGNPTIAGTKDPNLYADNIHMGVEVPEFPEVRTDHLAGLATNIVDASTNLKQPSFSNIRILANTNPTFSSDVVLNGIVYIEIPNRVHFEGKTTINGLVATEAGDYDPSNCMLFFAGRAEAMGVEVLPDTPEFAAVKQEKGTFVLAPNFAVTFAGNFGAINGSIAASQLTFTGTAEGVVRGSVIGLDDRPTSVNGNVDIYVDRANAEPNPTGFAKTFALVPESSSYTELATR